MQTKKRLLRFKTTGARLAILAAMILAAFIGNVTPAAAAPLLNLQSVAVGAQSGTLTAGTAGSATFTVTVTRSNGSPNTTTMSISGLPTGASGSFGSQSAWSPSNGTGSRTVPLTINVTAAVAAGSYNFTVQASGQGTNRSGTGTLTIQTAAQPQTITFGALANMTYGDADFNVSATASSGLTVSFVAADNCTVAGSLVHLTGAGSCTITASQPGNASWLPAPAVQQAFVIAQAGSTTAVTFEAGPYTYRGTPFTATAVATGAGGLNQSVAVVYSGDCTNVTSPNGCTATATFAGDTDHIGSSDAKSITILQGTPTITFGAAPLAQFPGSDFTVSATTNSDGALTYSVVSGPCTLVDANAGTFSPTGVGDCVVQVDTAATTNSAAGSAQQSVTVTPPLIHLYAVAGSTTLAGLTTVPVWGYNSLNAAVDHPGGDPLIVNEGETVQITLHNQLGESTALLFQGQAMIPDTTGVAPGGTKVYTFVAGQPGTYLYEAGLLPNSQHQVAMGLYGALVVQSATMGQAYDDAASAYDDEAVLVLSEIDPALNNSADPAAFDMRDYAPTYFLINGKVYPDTAPIESMAGNRLLLRYVNAGAKHHSMAVLGLRQNFVAKDASLLPELTHNVAAETLAPGQTGDAIAIVPAVTVASQFAVYDGSLLLENNGLPGFGGMLTFVAVSGSGGGTSGPLTSNVSLNPNTSNGSAPVLLSATINGASDPSIDAAEYFVDSVGGDGSGCVVTNGLGSAPASVSATIPTSGATAPCPNLATLTSANHTFYVHGHNSTGWGVVTSAVLNLDKTGPATTGLTLTPNPSNGTVNVALHGTGNDSASGSSNVVAAEYFIGTPGADGTGMVMAVNVASPIASLDATILAPVTGGNVSVHSKDALGNWGPFATIMLNVVGAGPVTSNVNVAPTPNNGTRPLSASQPVVRVTATMDSSGSTVVAAEGFIDSAPGTTVRGFPFVPSDGAWNSGHEIGTSDIPLSTIIALSDGNHTISVRGKDAAGNWGDWGAMDTTTLVIDKTAPMITTATLSACVNVLGTCTIVPGTAGVTLNVTANDGTGTGVTVQQYWIDGSATPPANPVVFTGTSVVINSATLAAGAHTVYVRVQDAATSWSAVSSLTLYVVQAVNDALTITASTSSQPQQSNQGAPGVLSNDQPVGILGRTATLVSGPVRTSGTGTGTIAVTCPNSTATAICADGSYRITLTPSGNGGNARAASKRGTYSFTYTETLNGVTTPPATVTITVN